jgi:hypothetical protein
MGTRRCHDYLDLHLHGTERIVSMFWKKKSIINDAFGEIEKDGIDGWRTVERRSFSLFDKTYSVHIVAVANRASNETINDLQEAALRRFQDLIVSKRSEIEEAIITHLHEVSIIPDYNCRYREGYSLGNIPSRFVASDILITRKGECTLYASDNAEEYGEYDDWDEGFVVQIIPEIAVWSKELYDGYVSGGGTLYKMYR